MKDEDVLEKLKSHTPMEGGYNFTISRKKHNPDGTIDEEQHTGEIECKRYVITDKGEILYEFSLKCTDGFRFVANTEVKEMSVSDFEYLWESGYFTKFSQENCTFYQVK